MKHENLVHKVNCMPPLNIFNELTFRALALGQSESERSALKKRLTNVSFVVYLWWPIYLNTLLIKPNFQGRKILFLEGVYWEKGSWSGTFSYCINFI